MTTKVVDIGEEREKRKELCLYCGADPHPTQLACPRILHVEIDPEFGVIVGITFRRDLARPDPV